MGNDFRVAGWMIEPRLNIVSRDGVTVHLEPKLMEVLVCLAHHAGEPVSKGELLQTVWPNTFVTDDVLKRAISELRRVFGDDVHESCVIETIPKRGYRLIAPVSLVNGTKQAAMPATPESVHRPTGLRARRWWAAAAIAILVSVLLVVVNQIRSTSAGSVPPIHSLAVLPLQNLSADPAQEYFSDGMTDALITDLAQISSLKVISRTSSMQYKQTRKPLPEIARELKVDGIVEGTVQRSGDHVRITAQLIHGPSDKHLWANTYDGDIRDALALESDLAEDIARHVQERITPTTLVEMGQPKRVDARVLESFLKGNYRLQHFGEGGGDGEKRKAAEYFQEAVDADPSFAPAYLGLAKAHLNLLWPSSQDALIAKKAAERALALDPNLSDAHQTLGDLNLSSWNWQVAEEEYRRAIAINPNNSNAHCFLGALLFILGKSDEAYRQYQIAQTLDPGWDYLSEALEQQGQFERALDIALMMIKRHPNNGYKHVELFRLYLKKGMYKEASSHFDEVALSFGFPEIAAEARRARALSGDLGALRASLKGWEHVMATHQAFIPVNLAEMHAALGDKDLAFYWLEQAYAQHEVAIASTDIGLEHLNMEYLLDPLRSDPRFKDLVRRMGLPQRESP